MRLKIALVLTLLGLVVMGLGVGQRTVWLPSDTVSAALPAGSTKSAPVTVIDAKLRDVHQGDVKVSVKGTSDIMAAIGRAHDVDAWVGDAAHVTIDGVDNAGLQSTFTAGDNSVPDPRGADLWQSEEDAHGTMVLSWDKPADGEWSILLAADGKTPAPADVTISWPNDQSTPWAILLIIIGGVMVVLGLALLFGPGGHKRPTAPAPGSRAALREAERQTRQRPRAAGPTNEGRGTETGTGNRTGGRPARALLGSILGLGLAAGLALPAQAATPPAPSAEVSSSHVGSSSAAVGSGPRYPVVLADQLHRIMESVAGTVDTADAAKDADKLKPRVGGPALALRTANYKIRAGNSKHDAPVGIAADPILTQVVSSTTTWPRTLITVTKDEKSPVYQAHVLVQTSPRANYKLFGSMLMLPGTTFPKVADAGSGSGAVQDGDRDGLRKSPESALHALAAVLTTGNKSKFAGQIAANTYVDQITKFQRAQIKANPKGKITFTHTIDTKYTAALHTADGGALVYGYLVNGMITVPKEAGGSIKLDPDYAVMAGSDTTRKGADITFGETVLLYVPSAGATDKAGSTKKIQLIAAAQEQVGAKLRK